VFRCTLNDAWHLHTNSSVLLAERETVDVDENEPVGHCTHIPLSSKVPEEQTEHQKYFAVQKHALSHTHTLQHQWAYLGLKYLLQIRDISDTQSCVKSDLLHRDCNGFLAICMVPRMCTQKIAISQSIVVYKEHTL
jgi:hypothetical protein